MSNLAMVSEAIAGLGALKTAFDLAKGLKDISDAANRNAAIIELQERILTAQQAQSSLTERIRELEEKVADFERWDTEKERYELKEIYPGSFARSIKANARGSEPAHLICAKCYEDRKRMVLQQADNVHLSCPECKTQIRFRQTQLPKVDRGRQGGWAV